MPKKARLPADERQLQVAHPIDQFVRIRLLVAGLSPSPEADRIALLRCVSLDLTGLPPAPEQVQHFLAVFEQDSEGAYTEVVDRLLQSPAYGERWSRWWLDQARYADSNGYSVDAPRQIWKYRDWVIGALNRDLPFDQFAVEQLAGDLLPNATDEQRVATGFHRNTQINQEGGIDPEQFRIDSVFDRVATTGTVWLGLSIGCAQCHDHKFDPILQKEYYQFFAFFNNQEEPNLTLYEPGIDAVSLKDERRRTDAMQREIVKNADAGVSDWESHLESGQRDALPVDIQKILQTEKSARTAPQNLALYAAGPGAADAVFQMAQQRLQQIDKLLEANVTTMVMKELATPRKTTVFVQGDFTRPSDEVTCGTPAALHPLSRNGAAINRLDLAKWIVAPDNPLTARVIVNRVWQQYFGRGLVETENDFGLQGSSPSHPELLDWLAVEFRDRGWSLKELHRVIVTSATYRQSSAVRADLQEKDPGNCLLARRLVERGVRFVQLYHTNWDHHGGPTENLEQHLPLVSKEIDQPCMALVRDLEQRGLLDDTNVIWGGEFGRTPMGEVRESTGRNHHIDAFTMWFAGGGFKPGVTFGETDEFGFGPVDRSVHVRDIHATLLHQMGISHERLTVRAQGLDFRLTGVLPARIVDEVLV